MHRSLFVPLAASLITLCTIGCNCGGDVVLNTHDGGTDAGRSDAGASDAGPADAGSGDGGTPEICVPPQVLITLDRTQTMHKTAAGAEPTDGPDYASAKFTQAINGIKALTASPFDQSIAFGLELWPKAEPGCVTLPQKIGGTNATNPSCEDGEVTVPTAVSTGTQISSALDPQTTVLCNTTPTGAGLLTAGAYLKAHSTDGGRLFIALVTDGADWDQSCPTPDPFAVVTGLYEDAGIETLIVGFSAEASLAAGGVGAGFLDDMACAGHTAKGFPDTCHQDDAGVWRSRGTNDGGLFFVATDAAELTTALHAFGKLICCGCIN